MLRSVTFDLLADCEPGLLPRAIAPFARRDLTTDQFRARRHGDTMALTIVVEQMPEQDVSYVEGNLRQIVGVRRLEVVLRGQVRAVA